MEFGKKLYRSSTNRWQSQILTAPPASLSWTDQGIGDYLNVDPTIIRLIWAIFACTGSGILVYFVAAIIIPSE